MSRNGAAPGRLVAFMAGGALAGALLAGAGSAPLAAQGVTYVTVTKPEMAGTMGLVARMAPGAMTETRVTTRTQGSLMRVDEGAESSTITDLAEGRLTSLNHEEKTFHTLTLEEMLAQAMGAGAALGGGPEPGSGPELKVERTGRTRSFDGYTAEQVLLILEPAASEGGVSRWDAGERPRGEEGAPGMAMVVENWVSRDFPGYQELRRAQESAAARAMGGAAAAWAQGLAADPAMVGAAERMAEEMKGLEGVSVRTVTSFVMVPPGASLDVEAVLAAVDQPLETASVAGLAAEGARDAARQALGGIMGRRRQQEQPETAPAAMGQSITMRITQQVESVRAGRIPDDVFQVPTGYREAPPGIG